MFYKLLFLFTVLSMTTFAAETQKKKAVPPRTRTGVIVKAEFTTDKPSAGSASGISKRSSNAWAILTLQLDAGRAVSVFDYVLRKDGTEYPCADMAMGEDEFNGRRRCDRILEAGKTCRLAFAIPNKEDIYELVFKLDPEHENPLKLNVPVKKEEPPAPPEKEETSEENQPAAKPQNKPQTAYGKAIQKAKDVSKKAAGKK